MGQPRKPIDAKMVYRLARILCTDEEIATIFDVSVDTLTRRFKDELVRGRAVGKASLRRCMWKSAMAGSTGTQVWMSKNLLGWKDRIEETNQTSLTVHISGVDDAQPDDARPDAEAGPWTGDADTPA